MSGDVADRTRSVIGTREMELESLRAQLDAITAENGRLRKMLLDCTSACGNEAMNYEDAPAMVLLRFDSKRELVESQDNYIKILKAELARVKAALGEANRKAMKLEGDLQEAVMFMERMKDFITSMTVRQKVDAFLARQAAGSEGGK